METNKPQFVHTDRIISDPEYIKWLGDVKQRFRSAQMKAALHVNSEMLSFYWSLGYDVTSRNFEKKYGKAIMANISSDLKAEFPNQTGFSVENLYLMKRWYVFYSQGDENLYQLGTESDHSADLSSMPAIFARVPWKHHVEIFRKSKSISEALFYVQQTINGNWSRRVLEDNIQSDLFHRQGQAPTNFDTRLPASESQLAQDMLKDPYNFDFLTMKQGYDEKELEDALITNITRFLLELGQGFAFVGRQMELRMSDGQSYFPDLVFYHIRLKRYVVIDLKAVAFKPEFAGKINFYISAADELLRGADDNPTIGLIICKESNKTVVEWTLRGIERPLGIATYQLQEVVDRTIAQISEK